jgi:hypothetical protein
MNKKFEWVCGESKDKGAYREREARLQEKESGGYKREKREHKSAEARLQQRGKKPGFKRANFAYVYIAILRTA